MPLQLCIGSGDLERVVVKAFAGLLSTGTSRQRYRDAFGRKSSARVLLASLNLPLRLEEAGVDKEGTSRKYLGGTGMTSENGTFDRGLVTVGAGNIRLREEETW